MLSQEARAQAQPGHVALIEATVSPPVVAPENPSSKRAAHRDDEAPGGDARERRGLVRGRIRPRARARGWGKGLGVRVRRVKLGMGLRLGLGSGSRVSTQGLGSGLSLGWVWAWVGGWGWGWAGVGVGGERTSSMRSSLIEAMGGRW